jgi:hypothetical protein
VSYFDATLGFRGEGHRLHRAQLADRLQVLAINGGGWKANSACLQQDLPQCHKDLGAQSAPD